MKNNILLIGIVLTFLNTIIGLVLSDYSNFNMLFVDISILISTVVLYYLFNSSITDGFKIGVGFVAVLSGLARYFCALFSIGQIENNIALIIFMCLISFELIAVFVAQKLSAK